MNHNAEKQTCRICQCLNSVCRRCAIAACTASACVFHIVYTLSAAYSALSCLSSLRHSVHVSQVVAFVKGTRTSPQCGFSHKVLSMLNDVRTDYEVVNVLDDLYNPGLREAIKTYSQWPTIPQVRGMRGSRRRECDMHLSAYVQSRRWSR